MPGSLLIWFIVFYISVAQTVGHNANTKVTDFIMHVPLNATQVVLYKSICQMHNINVQQFECGFC